MTLGRTLNFDETLPVGLLDVLAMQPADRISFDTMVLKAVETQLWTRIAELDTTLAEGAPDEEGRAAAVNSAQTTHDTVKSMQLDSISALDRARDMVTEGEAPLEAARKAGQVFSPELRQARKECEQAQARLAAFCEGPLAAFSHLQDARGFVAVWICPHCDAAATRRRYQKNLKPIFENPKSKTQK